MKPTNDAVKRQLAQQDKNFDEGPFPGTENETEQPVKIDEVAAATFGPDALGPDGEAQFDLSDELIKDENDQAGDESNEHPLKKEKKAEE
jgi:hypothetical protein